MSYVRADSNSSADLRRSKNFATFSESQLSDLLGDDDQGAQPLRSLKELPWEVPFDESLNRSSWLQTTFVVTAEVMGAGVLGLPLAVGRLGWLLGIGSLVVRRRP
jgi:hypothetical protein